MKTNRVQKHICDFLIEQIDWWRDSNDINSTTHVSELEDGLTDIVENEGWISREQADGIEAQLIGLLNQIRHLKE